MTALLAALCAALGLAIGSFLNVVVHRVPRGESVVSPPSACPRCGSAIRPRDNVPVLGWLLLRGRCHDCGEPISPRYPVVEALTGALFAVMGLRFGPDWALPAYLYLAAVGLALALIDLDTKRLPDVLTLPSYAVGALALAVPALVDNRGDDYVRALLGGLVMFGFYFLLCFAYPAGMGFGDVKLSGVLGLFLGFLGWGELVVGLFLGFFLGGLLGAVLMSVGKAGRKTKIPYGPFMLAGALFGILSGGDLAGAYLDLTGV